ncbi:type I polyketide synthase [Streptomyces sp. NPDC058195]|uniref:type I polyketide synthase n=1 Tax=Streptomyces sp. NPDC058195 TaxID=3346375 RepID=UPI0036F0FF5F
MPDPDAVAIVGMGCRFPGSPSPEVFWEKLCCGADLVGSPAAGRNSSDRNPGTSRAELRDMEVAGNYLPDVDLFEPAFFGMTPREASAVDPQHRILLEVAWESLEHAAIDAQTLRGQPVGVFVGLSTNDYGLLADKVSDPVGPYMALGNAKSLAANRISYALDLRGPSMTIDAACASSLVAVHQACRSLKLGESDLCLAGGVNLILSPTASASFGRARMLSPQRRCRSFDRSADGYVRAEGCGMVVLRRLADAVRDGDPVWAVILGAATNHVGAAPAITVPVAQAQAEVMSTALANARVNPGEVGYVEAHGTGTPSGDPVELAALAQVLRSAPSTGARCAVGSVKSNLGHLEAAAGMAGLIKAVHVVRTGLVPPSLHFERFADDVPDVTDRLFVPTELLPWGHPGPRRVAGVSAFGFGGTNCHVVVASVAGTGATRPAASSGPCLLALSARTEQSLAALAQRHAAYLKAHPDEALGDICHTMAAGRAAFGHRMAVRAPSAEAMAEAIVSDTPSNSAACVRRSSGDRPRVGLLVGSLTGVRAPDWLASVPAAAAAGQRLGASATTDAEVVAFRTLYQLIAAWRAWGVRPDLVAGAGTGNLLAMVAADALTAHDGLALTMLRARGVETDRRGATGRLRTPATPLFVSGYAGSCEGRSRDEADWAELWHPRRADGDADALAWLRARGASVVLQLGDTTPAGGTGPQLPTAAGAAEGSGLLDALALLFTTGVPIELGAVPAMAGNRLPSLPTYPFHRQPFWLADRPDDRAAAPATGARRTDLASAAGLLRPLGTEGTNWELVIDTRRLPYVADHRVHDAVVVPGVTLLEAVSAAARDRLGTAGLRFHDVEYRRVLILDDGSARVRLRLSAQTDGSLAFQIRSAGEATAGPAAEVVNVEGRVARADELARPEA